jgi:hypothetical protein
MAVFKNKVSFGLTTLAYRKEPLYGSLSPTLP